MGYMGIKGPRGNHPLDKSESAIIRLEFFPSLNMLVASQQGVTPPPQAV